MATGGVTYVSTTGRTKPVLTILVCMEESTVTANIAQPSDSSETTGNMDANNVLRERANIVATKVTDQNDGHDNLSNERSPDDIRKPDTDSGNTTD